MSEFNETKVAMIVEPRRHPCTNIVLRQFDEVLDDGWTFHIFAGEDNYEWMIAEANKTIHHHAWRVELLTGVFNLTTVTYSYLLTSVDFWRRVSGEHVLVFQMDTMPLPGSKYRPEDFFQYDWVGAPWPPDKKYRLKSAFTGRLITVGNGGLSLRKRSSTLVACAATRPNKVAIEDLYFSRFFFDHATYRVPDRETAGRFSAELCLLDQHPFGLHKPCDMSEFGDLQRRFTGVSEWWAMYQHPTPIPSSSPDQQRLFA